MKRLIMLATVLSVFAVMAPSIQASTPQTVALTQPSADVIQQTADASGKRQGFFARLWELEKRKNAAIRRALGW